MVNYATIKFEKEKKIEIIVDKFIIITDISCKWTHNSKEITSIYVLDYFFIPQKNQFGPWWLIKAFPRKNIILWYADIKNYFDAFSSIKHLLKSITIKYFIHVFCCT